MMSSQEGDGRGQRQMTMGSKHVCILSPRYVFTYILLLFSTNDCYNRFTSAIEVGYKTSNGGQGWDSKGKGA